MVSRTGEPEKRRSAIVQALVDAERPLTIHTLGAITGINHTTLYETLLVMEQRKQVRRQPNEARSLSNQSKQNHFVWELPA